MPSLLGGTLIFLVILLDVVYTIMPTAIYFLCIPLLVLLAGGAFTFFRRSSSSAPRQPSPLISLLLLIPAILLLAPIYSMFFVAFDLQSTSAAVPALIGILLGLALPLLSAVFRESRWLLPAGAISLCIIALLLGLMQNRSSNEQPFKTNLVYIKDADANKARWITFAMRPDTGNSRYFPNGQLVSLPLIIPGTGLSSQYVLTNEAPLLDLPAPTITIKKDSVIGDKRLISLHIQAAAGANSARVTLDPQGAVSDMILADSIRLVEPRDNSTTDRAYPDYWLEYKGISDEGFNLQFLLDRKNSLRMNVFARYIGLPEKAGFKGFPAGTIPGPGNYSNVTVVVKKFSL
jgi:hypothetical protein